MNLQRCRLAGLAVLFLLALFMFARNVLAIDGLANATACSDAGQQDTAAASPPASLSADPGQSRSRIARHSSGSP